LLRQFNIEIEELDAELIASFEGHADAEILCSLPGLGSVLGARVLAEFGDDPTRYKDARSRRCYAGGFDVSTTMRGNGLTNMEDRFDALGGGLQIESIPGVGTTLCAAVPVFHPMLAAS